MVVMFKEQSLLQCSEARLQMNADDALCLLDGVFAKLCAIKASSSASIHSSIRTKYPQ